MINDFYDAAFVLISLHKDIFMEKGMKIYRGIRMCEYSFV